MADIIVQIFKGLAGIPALASTINNIVTGLMLWYVQTVTRETTQEIADAAAFASRATNQEERRKALDMWRSAFSRPRVS